MSREKWVKAKAEIVQILQGRAKHGGGGSDSIITYGELVGLVQSMSLEPHSADLAEMLDEISTAENEDGHGMLSVLVVHQFESDRDQLPGPGFFKLARRLGRKFTDRQTFWVEESKRVYAAWAAH